MEETAANGIEELRTDHEHLKRLHRQWEGEPEGTQRNANLINLCLRELEVHSRVEQEILYPECRRVWIKDTGPIDEAIDDHRKMDAQIAAIRASAASEERLEDFRSLMEDVLNHFEEEESAIFPELDTTLSVQDSARLGDRLRARKAELRASSWPGQRAA